MKALKTHQARAEKNAKRRQLRRDKKAIARGALFERPTARKMTRKSLEADHVRLENLTRSLSERIDRMQQHAYWQPVAVGIGSTKFYPDPSGRPDGKVELVAVAANQSVNVYERAKVDGTERVGIAAQPTQPAIALIANGQLLGVLGRSELAWFVKALRMLAPRGVA